MTRKNRNQQRTKRRRGKPPNFLGQHLMYDKKLLHEVVNQAQVRKTDTVLELGAGRGALTTVLSERAHKVLAVEYDAKFVGVLKRKLAQFSHTKIIQQDIRNIRLPHEAFVVVSNIPYAITTPIMKLLLSNPHSGFERGVIVMEKGAAKRFTAPFVKNAYVLAWHLWFDIQYVKGISRKHFSPPPKVDSAMVYITRRQKPIVPYKYDAAFFGLAEYALQEPSAPVDMALSGVFTKPQLKHIRRSSSIRHDCPIGTLTAEQWGMVFKTMVQHVKRCLWPKRK